MASPTVSVCIPTYKGATVLGATIQSVLEQSFQDFEIWVLDDNSPDDTQAVVQSFADPRIQYIRHPVNLGPQGNWNRCLEVAQGRYFKLLPHDDLLASECLADQVEVFEQDPEETIALVFGSRHIIGPTGRKIMTRGLSRSASGRIGANSLAKRCVRAGTNVIGEPGNGLIRRNLIASIGKYDASYPYMVDLDYWFRALLYGDAFYVAKHASSFRITAGSWSVAIGSNQYRDFKGFLDKFRGDARCGISDTDRVIGLIAARMNTALRTVIYWFMFKGKR